MLLGNLVRPDGRRSSTTKGATCLNTQECDKTKKRQLPTKVVFSPFELDSATQRKRQFSTKVGFPPFGPDRANERKRQLSTKVVFPPFGLDLCSKQQPNTGNVHRKACLQSAEKHAGEGMLALVNWTNSSEKA
jgi:hypothetical protein